MSNINKIRQEIERRKEEYKQDRYMSDYRGQLAYYKDNIYDSLLAFIDSLPEEKPSDDLEEAAARYERENRESILSSVDIVDAFIAGAEWQKEQMMKDAIHYVVQDDLDSHGVSYNIPFLRIGRVALEPKGIGVGDKVKIIIVKQ